MQATPYRVGIPYRPGRTTGAGDSRATTGLLSSNGVASHMTTIPLGPAGPYSHRAARAVADDGEIAFAESMTAIVEAVAEGTADRGVVPVENSIEGSVTESLDAFTESNCSPRTSRTSPPTRPASSRSRQRVNARRAGASPPLSSTRTPTTPASCWNCWKPSPTVTSTSPVSSPDRVVSAWATTSSTSTRPPASTRSGARRRSKTSRRWPRTAGSDTLVPTTPRPSSTSSDGSGVGCTLQRLSPASVYTRP